MNEPSTCLCDVDIPLSELILKVCQAWEENAVSISVLVCITANGNDWHACRIWLCRCPTCIRKSSIPPCMVHVIALCPDVCILDNVYCHVQYDFFPKITKESIFLLTFYCMHWVHDIMTWLTAIHSWNNARHILTETNVSGLIFSLSIKAITSMTRECCK